MTLLGIVGVLLTAESGHLWRTVSDFFQLDDLLSPEDVALRERIRSVMEKHVAPVMTKVDISSSDRLFRSPFNLVHRQLFKNTLLYMHVLVMDSFDEI
jgi:hypothetical protein